MPSMNLPKPACRQLTGAVFFTLAAAAAGAASPPDAPKLVLSEGGDYVIDLRAKLAWPRCVEGMRWNGKTCTGQALLLDHAQAKALASQRFKAEGVRWRLPRVTELKRLIDRSAKPPGLDPLLFPAAPPDWHWSITANIKTSTVNQYNYGNLSQGRTEGSISQMQVSQGWAVNLGSGEASGEVSKRSKLPVRLVRPQD